MTENRSSQSAEDIDPLLPVTDTPSADGSPGNETVTETQARPQTPQHEIVDLPVEDISYDPKKRLRQVNPKKVAEIKPSIAEFGLLHPISVTRAEEPGKYLLRAGAHRFEAIKELQHTTVKATILKLSSVAGCIAEIDENLMIAELSAIERGEHLKKRKELYEMLHPETKKGTAQGEGKKRSMVKASDAQVGSEIVEDLSKQQSFVENTAAQTGLSETAIARDVERASKIADDVKQEIVGTALDKGTVLDELKNLPHEQQRERVKEKKAEASKPKPKHSPKCKSVPKATEPLEHKGTPAKYLTAQLEPCFKALWQLSVDLQKSEVRDWADKIERALEKKGYVPASERQRDSKGYLARIKPKPVELV
jgi:ParB/RepB/Spo0J family partition protein